MTDLWEVEAVLEVWRLKLLGCGVGAAFPGYFGAHGVVPPAAYQ